MGRIDEQLRQILAEIEAEKSATPTNEHRYQAIDWDQVWNMEFKYDWLVEQFWPMGTHLHLYASPKTGKSLVALWMASRIAVGRDPFSNERIERQRVTYIDNEMTLKDVRDRLVDMGYDAGDLQDWLLYHPYPTLAPMDTVQGGTETMELLSDDDSHILFIDTLSRVVRGEENSNDTYRNFYNFTGRLLKANDISMLRIDHAGHDPQKSRGASAKADDVDLVYRLEKRMDTSGIEGYRLTRTHSRIGIGHERIDLEKTEEPLVIKARGTHSWNVQAIDKAKELDELGAPIGVSNREASRLLKAAGLPVGKSNFLAEALRLRLQRSVGL
jgi:RecA-family ATPase